MFVFPASSDCGIPFGLVLWGYYNFYKGKKKKIKFINACMSKKYTNDDVLKILKKFNIPFDKYNPKHTANLLSQGKVVGRFFGSSESGPRALGNRSILADPRRPEMRDHINKNVKHREMFRPFAPSIMEEHAKKYFDTNYSPYMLEVSKAKYYNKVPSVCHVDKTARVQTVNKIQNKEYYNLISAFNDVTNVPCLLNTSFNDHGEPIVETPLDSIICFLQTEIDYLILNDHFLDKKKIKIPKVLLKKMRKYRDKEIKKNHLVAINTLTKNYSKKEYKIRKKIEDKNAIQVSVLNPLKKLRLISQKIKNNKKNTLIIGTDDHTGLYTKFFLKGAKNLKDIDFLNMYGNDTFTDSKNLVKFNRVKNINKKYKHIFISSYEYLDEIKEFLKAKGIKNYLTAYDNCSRSLINIHENKLNQIN